eukprot:CAMPEP_0181328068 /NCGR_PEP_ID=MMETSP1101-20121128/22481_1 /TAXON_ID=46948 /ORGANISM="Rhodomonas abbreviata, Strain Caron Lab Isolate" /LENGTH=177 /DNA_ID=CAMNT_0023436857 /DNA_START=193 /DNA_END=723 /DNA_ORIENTATION=-
MQAGMVVDEASLENLDLLLQSLNGYSNAKIVHIAQVILHGSRGDCHGPYLQAYVKALDTSCCVGDVRRCLAFFYVANEILQNTRNDRGWNSALANVLSKYLPRVCAIACEKHIEWNVPMNILRLPGVWRKDGIFPPEFCDKLQAMCEATYRGQYELQPEGVMRGGGMSMDGPEKDMG